MNKKIRQEKVKVVQTTNEFGELIEEEVSKEFTITCPKQDTYYSTFIDFLAPYYELTSEKAKDLCVKLCSMAEYNTGKVDISRAKRIQICKELNINNDNLSTYLTMLKKKNIIKEEKEYKGIYTINPLMFWKGENRLRVDAICNFSVEFVISLNNKQE
jgi:hypothetical protein